MGATPHDSEESFFADFVARLTECLEDGGDPDSVMHFIATQYGPRPLGDERNAIIRLVRRYQPLLTYQELADVCLTDKATGFPPS
jgi:hypothetical protein